eukprot:scaffold1505_cov390-Prasinococcus_capsulatus_cf.AAC.10
MGTDEGNEASEVEPMPAAQAARTPFQWFSMSEALTKRPVAIMLGTFLISAALGAASMVLGGFSVEADSQGYIARGTLRADRDIQRDVLENLWFLPDTGPQATKVG